MGDSEFKRGYPLVVKWMLDDIAESFRLLSEIDETYIFVGAHICEEPSVENIAYYPQLGWGWSFPDDD